VPLCQTVQHLFPVVFLCPSYPLLVLIGYLYNKEQILDHWDNQGNITSVNRFTSDEAFETVIFYPAPLGTVSNNSPSGKCPHFKLSTTFCSQLFLFLFHLPDIKPLKMVFSKQSWCFTCPNYSSVLITLVKYSSENGHENDLFCALSRFFSIFFCSTCAEVLRNASASFSPTCHSP
jgi:hypothetical protein